MQNQVLVMLEHLAAFYWDILGLCSDMSIKNSVHFLAELLQRLNFLSSLDVLFMAG